MGYRLTIRENDKEIEWGKHYGYSFVSARDGGIGFPSFAYLISIGKATDDEIYDYGFENKKLLTADEFRIFITLYTKEAFKHSKPQESCFYKDLIEMTNSENDKTIYWF